MTGSRNSASAHHGTANGVRRVLAWVGWTALVAVSWFVTYAALVLGGR